MPMRYLRQWRFLWMLNLLVPGTGLIVVGRPWLGLALAFWFGIAAELALVGALIAPADIPAVMTVVGGGLALVSWLVGQRLLARRLRRISEYHVFMNSSAERSDIA